MSLQAKTFIVHKKLLQISTSYFDDNKIFDSAEQPDGPIIIKDEHPDVFALLVKWAYTGKSFLIKLLTEYPADARLHRGN